MKKKRHAKTLLVAKQMPPLYHTIPGQEFDREKSDVLKWLSKQGELLEYLQSKLKGLGYIKYDPKTGLWQGEDWLGERNDEE